MDSSIVDPADTAPFSIETEKREQKKLWRFRPWKWIGSQEDPTPCAPVQEPEANNSKAGIGRRWSRRVVPGLPRPPTFKRQNSERREHLTPAPEHPVERKARSVERRRAMSARPASPAPICVPKLSAPAVCDVNHCHSHFEDDMHNGNEQLGLLHPHQVTRPEPPPSPPPEVRTAVSEVSNDDPSEEENIKAELEKKWILNLSMHFRDQSPREKFFVTYAETPTLWRRVTISCDYRNAPEDSLEKDLEGLQYQRDKSARIYEAIRSSLQDIQFYNTVTNLKLETSTDDRLHVHVTEDVNERIPYPSVTTVQHLKCELFRESDVHFQAHMSGFVYRVEVQEQIWIKKEIPGPDSVDEFLYEVNALYALIGSSNVIQFKGLVIDDGRTVVKGLLIAYAEQGSLVDTIYDLKNSIPWPRRERWAKQIVHGLSEIHGAGFVQGDFTLSNIVLDEHSEAQIIDINRRGCPVGWEPPEVAALIESGQRISMYIGVKSDLYQLGMVLWALAVQEDEPERQPRPLPLRLDGLHDDVLPYFWELIKTCLEDNPKARLAAKDLLKKFPELSNEDLPPMTRQHGLSVPSEKEYIDPAHAVERDDLDLHTHKARGREVSSDSYTYVGQQESIDDHLDDSDYFAPRGRKPALNTSHIDGSRLRGRPLPNTQDNQLSPQIVPISPTHGHTWRQIDDGEGGSFLVPRLSEEEDDDEDSEEEERLTKRESSKHRPISTPDGAPPRHEFAVEHIDSGLGDMGDVDYLAGVGGNEHLNYRRQPLDLGSLDLVEEHDRNITPVLNTELHLGGSDP